jgi:superfamily I DNA/RNA helicase
MKPIKIEEWISADGISLEENALHVAMKVESNLVVAGPGAGKTELLAQKACFLLQTNTCKFPHKILAISFKRDAAFNLKERIKLRCADELAKRFDSLTFDSFAKQLFDRFKQALPDDYKINSDYDILLRDQSILDFYQAEDINYYNTTNRDIILALHNLQLPHLNNTISEGIRNEVWKKMTKKGKLSFTMIMRLAEYIIDRNPKIRKYLNETYHFVFLDEFQDTTESQYDFFKSCFLGSDTFFTAVGDDKQRIMMWAGAEDTIFEDFLADTGASRVSLTMNFRCAPRLVTLLNYLTQHLLGKTDLATSSSKWQPEQGECFVWVFENPVSEMHMLFQEVQSWMATDGINARDICILVKQQLEQYAGELITYFNQNGIKARDENRLQDILTQEVSVFITNMLYTIFQKKAGEAKQHAFNFLSNLHTELNDEQLLKLEGSFSKFIKKVQGYYNSSPLNDDQIKSLVNEIIAFADKDRIRANFPAYKKLTELDRIIDFLLDELIKDYHIVDDIVLALHRLVGKDTIPVMTIHKSKGLEYHTVIFIGLEDGAFWSFERQPNEDKCAFFVALSRAKERVVFTFSKKREGRFGMRPQTMTKIKVILEELQNSGIVKIVEKK